MAYCNAIKLQVLSFQLAILILLKHNATLAKY